MNRAAAGRALDRICGFIGATAGLAAFAIAVLVAYSVLARELFRASESGIDDISSYLMAYITFVGAAYGLWEGAHVGVHLLTGYVRGRTRAAVLLVTNALLLAVAAVFAWLAFAFWLDAWRSGESGWGTLSMPLWIPYSAMMAGTILFLVVQLGRLALGRMEFEPAVHPME